MCVCVWCVCVCVREEERKKDGGRGRERGRERYERCVCVCTCVCVYVCGGREGGRKGSSQILSVLSSLTGVDVPIGRVATLTIITVVDSHSLLTCGCCISTVVSIEVS